METSDWERIKLALYWTTQSLPEDLREVINYHYYDGLTVNEIAKKLNFSCKYVSSKIKKAECKLRRQLNPSYYERAKKILYQRLPNHISY